MTPENTSIRLLVCEAIAAYGVFLDNGEFKRLARLFCEDVLMNIQPAPEYMNVPLRGRDQVVAALQARHREVRQAGGRRHICSNTVFEELSRTSCRTRTYLTSIATSPGRPGEIFATGEYRDRLVPGDGGWLFAERHVALDA